MTLRYLAYLETCVPGPESLATAPRARLGDDELRIVLAYLGGGNVLAASGAVHDVLDPTRRRVAPAAVMTDGAWVWAGELAYYVETYGLALHPDFLRHARERRGEVPALDRESLARISDIVQAEMFRMWGPSGPGDDRRGGT